MLHLPIIGDGGSNEHTSHDFSVFVLYVQNLVFLSSVVWQAPLNRSGHTYPSAKKSFDVKERFTTSPTFTATIRRQVEDAVRGHED